MLRATVSRLANATIEVKWNQKKGKYEPVDSTGWQFSGTRGSVVVETDDYGLVALIPMGMAQVSSVNFEDNVTVGNTFTKGDMLGTFLFGGSDYVILFQEQAGFELTAPKSDHVLMGEQYGIMNG
jgi:phosphatidylserine decarboxylase